MGQYMKLVNVSKKESVSPHALGLGAKQWENYEDLGKVLYALCCYRHSRGGGDLPAHPLLGRWHGDRVAVIGDYAEKDDIQDADAEDLYSNAADISGIVAEWLEFMKRQRLT